MWNDLLITRMSLSYITMFKAYFSSCFRMKDLGLLKYFLGIKIARNSSSMYLCQRKYVLEMLSKTGFSSAKLAYTPPLPNHNLAKHTGD